MKVTQPRFFETERGFQGELLANLRASLSQANLSSDVVIEQEYQKSLRDHGITARPDIIIHIPTRPGGNRCEGNFAMVELKLRANAANAREVFDKLDRSLRVLDYALGVFVNIAAEHTHAEQYAGPYAGRIQFFAVRLTSKGVQVRRAHYQGYELVEEIYEAANAGV